MGSMIGGRIGRGGDRIMDSRKVRDPRNILFTALGRIGGEQATEALVKNLIDWKWRGDCITLSF